MDKAKVVNRFARDWIKRM